MTINEIMELSKSTGIDDMEFEFTNLTGQVVKCVVLDAYFGLFKINGVDGFIRDTQWNNSVGHLFDLRVTSELP